MSKVRKIRVNVESEAMISDPSPDSNPDRGDFFLSNPYPCEPCSALSRKIPYGQSSNKYLFKCAQVRMDVATMSGQVNNRVADKLARAMKGHIPTASNPVHWHLPRIQHVTLVPSPAQGKDGWMFKQEQGVFPFPLVLLSHEFFLQSKGLGIFNKTEVYTVQLHDPCSSQRDGGHRPPYIFPTPYTLHPKS
jgi:hypothetical protein